MEVVALADVRIDRRHSGATDAGGGLLAFALVFFTIIKILVNVDGIKLFAFVGLILSLVSRAGGYLRWESRGSRRRPFHRRVEAASRVTLPALARAPCWNRRHPLASFARRPRRRT